MSDYPFGADACYLEISYNALTVATVPSCNEFLELAAFKKESAFTRMLTIFYNA